MNVFHNSEKRKDKQWRYGAILDAGSSGTRLYIYRWHDHEYQRIEATPEQLNSLPELETKKKWTKKVRPGVSSFADNVENVGPEHLSPLLKHALEFIPADQVKNTPIFLLATAGVRLLPKLKRESLLREICNYAMTETEFLLPDCSLHIQAITGETEGLYGWIAANYLLDAFDATSKHQHGKGHHTYGFLDMGGASAQIAFAPNATETEKHEDALKLLRLRKLNGQPLDYKVFVTTWLGFGVNEARTRYVEDLMKNSGGKGILEIPDPCLHRGLRATIDGKAVDKSNKDDPVKPATDEYPYLLGTGKYEECQHQVHPLLSKDIPCDASGCLLGGNDFPKIDFDVNHFLGVSEYWHTTQEVFEMGHDTKAYDLATYSKRVKDFCTSDWSEVEAAANDKQFGKKVDAERVMKICFKASWMVNVLHDGLGIPRVGIETAGDGHNGTEDLIEGAKAKGFLDPFQAVDKIEDVEVSWTLGKMVLYAASMVPPATASSKGDLGINLPVGFGSNRGFKASGKIPDDFEYASQYSQTKPSLPINQPATPVVNTSESRVAYASGYPSGYATNSPLETVNDLDHWHSTLWNNTNSTRRIPGLILFLFMLSIASYLLLGRERRSRIYRQFNGVLPNILKGKKRRMVGSSGHVAYERVMEEGDLESGFTAAGTTGSSNPNSFELSEYEDEEPSSGSSNEGSRAGSLRLSASSAALGLGLTSSGATRIGSRIASRERLALSRSRDASPLRPSIAGRRISSKYPNNKIDALD